MMPLTCSIACAASATADWIAPTWLAISSVAFEVCPASDLTSAATTAKPLSGGARARRLDRRIQREQVGLSGDRLDQSDHLADAGRGIAKLRHGAHRAPGLVDGAAGDFGRTGRLLGDTARSTPPVPRPSSPPW